jgi:hypothetical protein
MRTDAKNKPRPQRPTGGVRAKKGVRIPTFRETQRAAHLDSAGREALHGQYPHLPHGGCPVEAAETVTPLRANSTVIAFVVGLCWLLTITLAVVFPNWELLGRGGPADVWLLGVGLSGGETLILLVWVSRNQRAREQALSVAAGGPDWDPWPVALAWKGRRPRPWRWHSGALPWWW